MSDLVTGLGDVPEGYADWLTHLKQRVHSAQQRAALAVNSELVSLYWRIGREILDRQAVNGWGSKIVDRLAHDLRVAFPDVRGFSRANLMYMRAFASARTWEEIVQQPVGQLPWAHNLVLLTKLKTPEDRIPSASRNTNSRKRCRRSWPRTYPRSGRSNGNSKEASRELHEGTEGPDRAERFSTTGVADPDRRHCGRPGWKPAVSEPGKLEEPATHKDFLLVRREDVRLSLVGADIRMDGIASAAASWTGRHAADAKGVQA